VNLRYGQVWDIRFFKSDHIPNLPRSIWDTVVLRYWIPKLDYIPDPIWIFQVEFET
ncbi:12434_t:CDS:2, partial [Funneliformis geosporum]